MTLDMSIRTAFFFAGWIPQVRKIASDILIMIWWNCLRNTRSAFDYLNPAADESDLSSHNHNYYFLKARLHDQSLPSKTICSKKTVKVIPFTQSKFGQSFYPKLPFCGKFKDKRYGLMVLILKRCFEWSIPIKVFF